MPWLSPTNTNEYLSFIGGLDPRANAPIPDILDEGVANGACLPI